MDSNDDIHIAFYDETGDDLYYVTDTSGSFVDSNLMDISNAGGMALDIAVSPITDEPGISYLNAHSDDLEYKVYDGSSWSTEVVHSSEVLDDTILLLMIPKVLLISLMR